MIEIWLRCYAYIPDRIHLLLSVKRDQMQPLTFLEKLLGRNSLGKGFHKDFSFHFLTLSKEKKKKKAIAFLGSVYLLTNPSYLSTINQSSRFVVYLF